MYRQTRIPRLRAILWVSVSDAPTALAEATDPRGTNPTAGVAPTVGTASAPTSLIVPDGCMDLIVLDSTVIVAGADSKARSFTGSGRPVIGLRFDPGVLPQLLSTSAAELADRVTPLEAVLVRNALLDNPADTVAAAAADSTPLGPNGECSISTAARRLIRIAETLTARAEVDRRAMAVAELLGPRRGSAQMSIAEVSARFAYSPRQLRRLSADWFGYGPKHLSKVLRWQAARELIDSGRTRTEAAALVGCADASHLWRDERSLLAQPNVANRSTVFPSGSETTA